ncbi:MAG TPA: hypothetical protein VH352_04060, partial [Pseudonocardiaceae bacterium]|nr:hypothetical protein [Pseudonocardiaceae bacterium]
MPSSLVITLGVHPQTPPGGLRPRTPRMVRTLMCCAHRPGGWRVRGLAVGGPSGVTGSLAA